MSNQLRNVLKLSTKASVRSMKYLSAYSSSSTRISSALSHRLLARMFVMTSFILNTMRRTCPIQYGSCQVAESIRISICRPCSISCNDGNSPVCQYLDAKQGLYRKKRPLAASLEIVQNGVCHLNKATLSDITMFCCGKPGQYLVTYNIKNISICTLYFNILMLF